MFSFTFVNGIPKKLPPPPKKKEVIEPVVSRVRTSGMADIDVGDDGNEILGILYLSP